METATVPAAARSSTDGLPHDEGVAGPAELRRDVEAALCAILDRADDRAIDAAWAAARDSARELVFRPAKRIRALLFLAGYRLGGGRPRAAGAVEFAASLELLHTFMLVHDDLADGATLRRGGAPLHALLAPGKLGEDLAVVAGDHLFAAAVEAMLASELPGAAEATRLVLRSCRETAAGQYLDLSLGHAPLKDVRPSQVLEVARLKTARYGFVTPLVAGATLAGIRGEPLRTLESLGESAGVAFQLRDDLLGLFGDARVIGKSGGADFETGKRTFPLVCAYARADAEGRALLEALWNGELGRDAAALERARREVDRFGGKRITERAAEWMRRRSERALAALGAHELDRQLLDALLKRLWASA